MKVIKATNINFCKEKLKLSHKKPTIETVKISIHLWIFHLISESKKAQMGIVKSRATTLLSI